MHTTITFALCAWVSNNPFLFFHHFPLLFSTTTPPQASFDLNLLFSPPRVHTGMARKKLTKMARGNKKAFNMQNGQPIFPPDVSRSSSKNESYSTLDHWCLACLHTKTKGTSRTYLTGKEVVHHVSSSSPHESKSPKIKTADPLDPLLIQAGQLCGFCNGSESTTTTMTTIDQYSCNASHTYGVCTSCNEFIQKKLQRWKKQVSIKGFILSFPKPTPTSPRLTLPPLFLIFPPLPPSSPSSPSPTLKGCQFCIESIFSYHHKRHYLTQPVVSIGKQQAKHGQLHHQHRSLVFRMFARVPTSGWFPGMDNCPFNEVSHK